MDGCLFLMDMQVDGEMWASATEMILPSASTIPTTPPPLNTHTQTQIDTHRHHNTNPLKCQSEL